MIIDSHVHLYPPEIGADPISWAARFGEAHWATMCTRRRRTGRPVQAFPSVDTLLRVMDEAGVSRAILLGWYWETAAACAGQNRFYAACVRAYPDRLSGFATVQPRDGAREARDEARRSWDEGLIGLGELSPHSQGYAIDDPGFADLLALAGEAGHAVNLHVTDPESRPYPGRVETPLADFISLARQFPRTTFVLAHWGGMIARTGLGPALAALPNVIFDTAATPLLYGAGVWPEALRACGSTRVLFGSDYPLDLYPKSGDEPDLARLVAEARQGGADDAVLAGNAVRRLLRRS